MRTAACLLACLLLACGGDDNQATKADASSSPDGEPGIPNECAGTCTMLTLQVTMNGTTRDLDRAYYGFTAATESDSGQRELHIEAYNGGDPGCPNETSASPNQTLVISGLLATPAAATVSSGSVNLVDLEGALLPVVPTAKATSHTVSWSAINYTATDPFIAMDIEATFPDGPLAGHLYATHCDSLDAP